MNSCKLTPTRPWHRPWAAPPMPEAVIIYFIMGRSGNSRNRIFEATGDGIRTRAYDESKMVDPPIIYTRCARWGR